MDIVVDPAGVPTMRDADDFTSLRLTGTAPTAPESRDALAGWGIELTPDATHGHIAPAAFARLAGDAADQPDWQRGLAGMLAYATSKGWADDAGRIRAHAEWVA
jgi:hypothetical protein